MTYAVHIHRAKLSGAKPLTPNQFVNLVRKLV